MLLLLLDVGENLQKITDHDDNLIALVIDINDSKESKNFYTDESNDIQFGVFNLHENEVIEKHFHPEQERSIKTTSEVLIILEGTVMASLFDKKLEFLKEITLRSGFVLITFNGGHGLKVLEDTKLLEVKQGPYNDQTDKIRF
jgi:cupin fold WbuC family metalloprotein